MLKLYWKPLLFVIICLVSIYIVLQPTTASHFGYALGDKMPEKILNNSRIYRKGYDCLSEKEMDKKYQKSSLVQIDFIFNAFGSPYQVFATNPQRNLTQTGLLVLHGTCYTGYGLEGGP
ncbi:MAG: hypothetical protein Q7S61_03875 [bacterium]|nr:hypothetical protein [bacterium]